MTNKEKVFLIVELMDLLDHWENYVKKIKKSFRLKKSVKTSLNIELCKCQ